MFSNNLFFLILLFGGINTFIQAQVSFEVLPKEESLKITNQTQISPASSAKSSNFAQQIAVEQAKIRAKISNITTTQTQILEKLSNLEKQIAQLMQNTLPIQATDHKESIDVVTNSNFEPLRFNTRCGQNAEVTNDGKTALRTNPHFQFNYASVLTQRPLRSNELFEVRLDRLTTNWAGDLKIGVTTHSAEEMNFSGDMQDEKTGTWVMVYSHVYHNNEIIIDSYGQDLRGFEVGDRVGVLRKDDGSLHFYVNDRDQGIAAQDVPAVVYGVIDLYGKAVEASIVDNFNEM